MSTCMAKAETIERKWYVIDAAGQPLGKTAVKAADILRGTNRTFRETGRLSKEYPGPATSETPEQQMTALADHLNSAEEMEAAYANLETAITDAVHQADATGTISAMDIQALKQVRAGLRIMQKMSRKEQFEIPFSINGQWNVMHLSIVQNENEKGLLQADVPTDSYGTLSASLTWNETHWDGNFASDTQEGTILLERSQDMLAEALHVMTADTSDTPTTNEMYRMAKQLVGFMKQLANE